MATRTYSDLLGGVSELLESARRASARAVNAFMTATYWEVGRRIVEFEQGGAKRAVYGEQLLKRLASDLTARLGRGFSVQNIENMRLFYGVCGTKEKPWTQKLWIYDLRTNLHFTLKENTLKRGDLDDFVACFNRKNRSDRRETERFKSFTYEELTKRDKLNLDIFWLKDEALEESANLPAPEVIAADITADLEAALEQFATIAEDLKTDG